MKYWIILPKRIYLSKLELEFMSQMCLFNTFDSKENNNQLIVDKETIEMSFIDFIFKRHIYTCNYNKHYEGGFDIFDSKNNKFCEIHLIKI